MADFKLISAAPAVEWALKTSRVGLTQRGAKNNMVGVKGFEPSTSCSQSRRATQAALHPDAHIIALRSLSVNCSHSEVQT